MKHVYEIAIYRRLVSTTWCIAVSGVGFVLLVYNALQDLPFCIQYIYIAYGCYTVYQFREPYRSIQHVYDSAVCCILVATTCCSAMSGVGLVHLVNNGLRDLPACIQFIYTAYGISTPYEFREPHRSLQGLYKITVCFRLLATTWCSAMSRVRLVHLVYNALWVLPDCIQFIYTAYGSCMVYQFREPYRSIQHVSRFPFAADCLTRPSVLP